MDLSQSQKQDLSLLHEFIDSQTYVLKDKLHNAIKNEDVEYDVAYEIFLKSVENFKIQLMGELKKHIYPKWMTEEKRKEQQILNQMKGLINGKIKLAIDKLNTETKLENKQQLIEQIQVLNDSLQKIESSMTPFDYSRGFSPLNMSTFSHDNAVSMQDEFDCIQGSNMLTQEINKSIEAPQPNSIITPLVEKKPKINSDQTNKLTPILSASAENNKFGSFKTPIQFQVQQKTQQPGISVVTSGPKEINHHQHETHQQLNSFNKTDETTPDSGRITPAKNTLTEQNKDGEKNSVSLFEMFDKCLQGIPKRDNELQISDLNGTLGASINTNKLNSISNGGLGSSSQINDQFELSLGRKKLFEKENISNEEEKYQTGLFQQETGNFDGYKNQYQQQMTPEIKNAHETEPNDNNNITPSLNQFDLSEDETQKTIDTSSYKKIPAQKCDGSALKRTSLTPTRLSYELKMSELNGSRRQSLSPCTSAKKLQQSQSEKAYDLPTPERKHIKIKKQLKSIMLRNLLRVWRENSMQQSSQQYPDISLSKSETDFDLIHGKIGSVDDLDIMKLKSSAKKFKENYSRIEKILFQQQNPTTTKSSEERDNGFESKDFQNLINGEEIAKDFSSNNLLSEQLSFCDDNLGCISQPVSSSKKKNLSSQRNSMSRLTSQDREKSTPRKVPVLIKSSSSRKIISKAETSLSSSQNERSNKHHTPTATGVNQKNIDRFLNKNIRSRDNSTKTPKSREGSRTPKTQISTDNVNNSELQDSQSSNHYKRGTSRLTRETMASKIKREQTEQTKKEALNQSRPLSGKLSSQKRESKKIPSSKNDSNNSTISSSKQSLKVSSGSQLIPSSSAVNSTGVSTNCNSSEAGSIKSSGPKRSSSRVMASKINSNVENIQLGNTVNLGKGKRSSSISGIKSNINQIGQKNEISANTTGHVKSKGGGSSSALKANKENSKNIFKANSSPNSKGPSSRFQGANNYSMNARK